MLPTVQAALKRRVAEGATELFRIDLGEPVIEIPRDLALGDLASPVAFELAKRIKSATGEKQNPRQIATALAEWLFDPSRRVAGVERIEIAGAGYVNFFLDRGAFLTASARDETRPAVAASGEKVLVEHSSVNPNKAAHVGHLRNSVLGDTVVRMLRAAGQTVEVQNYLDNTGVQVADVVVGFLHVEPHTIDEVKAIPEPFDFYCADLYTKVGLFYRDGDINGKENAEKLKLRAEVQHAIEAGEGEIAAMAEIVAMRNVERHLLTMHRLGIEYDVLPRESEILHSNFWSEAFEMLKEHGAVQYVETGKQAGCWVMKAEEERAESDESDQFAADKILVKSNGIITYTGKDIAYHLWKLNRIARDFHYRRFHTYPSGRVAWVTAPDEGETGHPRFGHGTRYVNVIDVGQSYVQDFVKRAALAIAPDDPGVRASTHLNYEKVGLTPATVEELGLEVSETDRSRTFIPMSGRKGLVINADDLVDRLEAAALEEVRKRERGYPEEEERDIAHKIAGGALRYFLLKYTRNTVIALDVREALAFEGETGPYIQNAVVRINSTFAKLEEAGIEHEGALSRADERAVADVLYEDKDLWPLVYAAAQLPDVIDRAVAALEPATIAKYAFELAQEFNKVYQNPKYRILAEKGASRRAVLVEVFRLVRRTLAAALDTLGIEAPRRM